MKEKTKHVKKVIAKPFLLMIKDIRENRKETQRRVTSFNEELAEKINRNNILLREISEVQGRITQLRHLVEMYKVMDEHGIFDLWKLEKALGVSDKKYGDWKFDFERTKDGVKLKT